MEAAVREATADDADVVARILRSSFRDVAERFNLTRQNAPTHPSNCQPDWVRSDIARGISYLLLKYQNELAGCVALETASRDLAYLERLGVLPALRGRGFGAWLVRSAVAQAAAARISIVSAGVIAEHTELVSWYEHLGFVQAGTKRFPHLPFTVLYLEYATS